MTGPCNGMCRRCIAPGRHQYYATIGIQKGPDDSILDSTLSSGCACHSFKSLVWDNYYLRHIGRNLLPKSRQGNASSSSGLCRLQVISLIDKDIYWADEKLMKRINCSFLIEEKPPPMIRWWSLNLTLLIQSTTMDSYCTCLIIRSKCHQSVSYGGT